MDTSETYIKMCEKAVEIQGLWQPSDWDNVWCKQEAEVVVLSGYCTDGGYYGHHTPGKQLDYYTGSCDDLSQDNFKDFHIWLPRQDQLQEMIHDYKYKLGRFSGSHGLIRDFAFWVEEVSNLPCASMEQLWLAFLMHDPYRKKWTREDWIKE